MGGFEVTEVWDEGTLMTATVRSLKGQPLRLAYPDISQATVTLDGQPLTPTVINADRIELPTTADATYVITMPAAVGVPSLRSALSPSSAPSPVYDLQGRPVTPDRSRLPSTSLHPGIYVQNGQKFAVSK